MNTVKKKSILKPHIRKMLLEDTTKIVALEKAVVGNFFTTRNQLISDSPKLCQPHYMDAIKKILGLPKGEIIYDLVPDQKELHHD